MIRREFPKAVKLAAWTRARGKCEECTARLVPGKFAYDHILADGLTGEPCLENCAVVCTNCHGRKTHKHDIPAIAKAKRLHTTHIGAKAPSRNPMPGSRCSKWKKPMHGKAVLREPDPPDPLEDYDLHHGGLQQRKEIIE